MVRIAVLGGRGFIGRNLARHLAGRTDLSGGEVLACEQEGLHDGARLLHRFAPEALVWAAGSRAGSPEELAEAHVTAALANLEACRATLRRFVYLSSAEVYGPAAVPFREDMAPSPASDYARAKVAGERALTARTAELGVELVVLRPAVVYGPGQAPVAFIPLLARALRAGERFAMTQGEQTRDFLFVEDLCSLVAAALAPGAPPGLYNAGSGREIGLRDVGLLAARLAGGDPAGSLDVGAVPYREHEQMRYVLDPARARAALGWEAATSLEAGLALTLGVRTDELARPPSAP